LVAAMQVNENKQLMNGGVPPSKKMNNFVMNPGNIEDNFSPERT
jgi:hypothetical protein